MASPSQSSDEVIRRIKCGSCRASIPVSEADADGFIDCFCGNREPATRAAALSAAREALAVATRRAVEQGIA